MKSRVAGGVVAGIVLVAACTLLSWSAGAFAGEASPEPIWQVGKLDDSAADLALGPHEEYLKFPASFPEDVRFTVGTSDPARHFAYIHPGPKDAWAGSRAHAVSISFSLAAAPSGTFVLLVDLTRSHETFPPTLTFELNGREISRLETPRAGGNQERYVELPSDLLKRGDNEIRIHNRAGSWVTYDGLRIERFPPGVPLVRLTGLWFRDTILFRQIEGELYQIVRANVEGFWDGRGTFRLRGANFEKEFPAEQFLVSAGAYDLPIHPPDKPILCSLELVTPAGTLAAKELKVISPHRKWTVFAALKTHYDLGYTHPVDEMLQNAAGPMLQKILEYCEVTRDFPDDTRFRWIYPTWVLNRIRSTASAGGKQVSDALREGSLGWHAAPFTLHSYFCGMEDMVRAWYPSTRLEAEFGRRVRWAKQTDVPGHTRFLPQVLAASGVRLLQIGANFGVRGEKTPLLFYWEAPDSSRVLTQLTDGYGWGYDESLLERLEQDPSYPWDAFLAMYVTGDNVGPANLVEVALEARDLRERYAYPRIRIGPVEEFVDAIEASGKEKVPVLKTELTDWWIHGVASMAREVSMARLARELLPAAEKLWAFSAVVAGGRGRRIEPPRMRFDAAYEQSLLFSEHTWGMAGFKPEPQPPEKRDLETNPSEGYLQMRRSWEVKGDEARAALAQAQKLAGEGIRELGTSLGLQAGTIVVFNPLNWKRRDIVRIRANGPVRAVREAPAGTEVPWQMDGDAIAFLATVPPCGHASYILEAAKDRAAPTAPPVPRTDAMENAAYRLTLDAASGTIRSLVDKRTGTDLVDPRSPHHLGQYVYEGMASAGDAGWHGSPYQGKGTGRLTPSIRATRREDGPAFARFVAEGSLPIDGFPVEIGSVDRVTYRFTLPKDLDWIECEVLLAGKKPTALVEQGNVAFPFLVPGGKFRLELLGSVVDPESDLQEGGNHDAFAVQHWVDISGPQGGVTWSPIDTTIVTLGDFRLFHWSPSYRPESTRLYANAINNGWSTNFQEWQGGDFCFRFRLRSHAGDWQEGGAARFGRETAQPLLVARVESADAGAAGEASRGSLLTAEAAQAILVNFKAAEDGDGYILRFHNPAPGDDTVRIAFPGRAVTAARRVLATEIPMPEATPGDATLPLKDGGFTLRMGPFSLETVKIRF